MIQSARLQFVIISLITLTLSPAAATRILFLGLSGEGAPAIEKSFDRVLRDRISTTSGLSVIGYDESQRYRRTLDIDRSGTIAEEQLAKLEEHLPDSVFVAWGHVKKLMLIPVRKNLIRTEISGELQTGLTVYNLSRRSFSYSGVIESTASKRKEFILFEPVGLTHIAAADREELIEKLISKAVSGCTDIIESLRRSEQMAPDKTIPLADTITYRPPSISDVFAVPSVEAAEISGRTAPPKPNPAPTAQGKTNSSSSGK